jgi:hypothetical protein
MNTSTDALKTNTPKSSGGFTLGQSSTDLVALHGAAPVAQRSGAAQAAVVTTTPATSQYGYTLAQATAIITLLNEIRAALVEKGIIAGA